MPARAGEHRFDLLLDTDNNSATGCTVAEPTGPIAGIEQKFSIYVDTSTTTGTVNRITRQVCGSGLLGTETVVDSSGWPAGLGNGTGGTAALESYVTRNLLPATGQMRVTTASSSDGSGDVAPAFTLALGDVVPPPPPPPPPGSAAVPVPLAPWLSGVIALAIALAALLWQRRHPQHLPLLLMVMLCSVSTLVWAATVVLDGNINDWAGVAPSVTDPRGDAPVDTDIVAVYTQRDATRLYFRIDADVEVDGSGTPGNTAPVVSAGADQTITLPATASLAGTASDDGLPNPPGALTLGWSQTAGPAPVTFSNATSPITTATFALAGVYTLTLTANDGALSSSSNTHITVNAAVAQDLSLAPVPDSNILVGTPFAAALSASSSQPAILTYTLDVAPAGATIGPGAAVHWTPTASQLGTNTFTARVSDSNGHAATTTFNVTVAYTNHPPQLAAQADTSLPVGTPFSRTLTATDPDAGDSLTFALVAGPAGMALVGATLDWSTTSEAPGGYAVTVRVTDSGGLSDSRQFVVTLLPPTPPPFANDDSYSVRLGDTLAVPAPGVLTNDVDPSGGSLTALKISDPDKGVLSSFNADGSFSYTAPAIAAGPVFAPTLKWNNAAQNWVGNSNPLIADVFANGKPVVFAVRRNNEGGVTAIDGATGTTLWTVTGELPAPNTGCYIQGDITPENQTADSIAVGDIDDSGIPAVVTAAKCLADGAQSTRLITLNARTGAVKWLTPPLGAFIVNSNGVNFYFGMTNGITPVIARLHPAETPSVLFKVDAEGYLDNASTQRSCDQFQVNSGLSLCTGVMILDGTDGSVRQRLIAPNDDVGRENFAGGQLMVADLTGSGTLNLVANGAVWDVDGNLISNRLGAQARSIALAQLDDSGQVSIISYERSGSSFIVARHADGTLQWQTPIDTSTVSGMLSVADLDGDGSPDIMATAEGNLYVYDARGQIKWTHRYADASNLRTIDVGKRPAAFDLDGDGIAEVIVPTTSGLEFTDGATGKTKMTLTWADLGVTNTGYGDGYAPAFSTSAVVADIDGSGHASIVVTIPSFVFGSSQYVVAISATNDDWRPAPTVFNEFSYHVTNVDSIGHIPTVEVNAFATPRTNVFGAQAQAQAPIDPRVFQGTTFTYAVSNGTLTSQPATVSIDIRPQNRPPVFTSVAPTVYVPVAFTYAAHAADPDPGDSVTYGMLLPTGNGVTSCSVDANSGLVTCVNLFSGDQFFTVVATDTQGASAYQSVHLLQSAGSAVVPSVIGEQQADAATTLNSAGFVLGNVSTISSSSPTGQVLSQAPSGGASAVLGEAIAVTVSSGPAPVPMPSVVGLGLPDVTSLLTGLGFTLDVTYVASTTAPIGTVLTQAPAAGTLVAPTPANPVTLTVSLGPQPSSANLAQINVAPGVTGHLVGESASFIATGIYSDKSATDFTHVATWSSSDTHVATVDADGTAHALHPGTTSIIAKVGSIVGQGTLQVSAPIPGDSTPPVALITAPVGGSEVTTITSVTGTATDANFLRYELAIAASTDTNFTLIGQGTAQVTAGVLGSLDPTLLVNGAYTMRLTVYDAGGNTTVANATIVVTGAQKVGNFTLSYTDLTVPLSGIPIQITRNYDSRDKRVGDFGVGWTLGINALQVSTSGVVGEAWEVGLSSGTYFLIPDVNHFVSVTLPSGRVETFDVQLSPTSSFLQQFSTVQATFVPRAGVLGTLQSLDNTNLLIADPQPGPITLIDDTTLNTFNPDRFRYTQRDGTQFVVTRTHGVESVKDTNGNQITITPGGISHSSGANIVFNRDVVGRILGITDPSGNTRGYAYTANGDLGTATDRSTNTTRYTYDGQHGLLRIDDPLGRPVARAEYDDQGRLIALTDAAGHTTAYDHNLPGRQEQVTDALGHVTVRDYDDRGNVLSSTDPLGNTSLKTYDAQDNVLTETDPLGNTVTYTYSPQSDLLSITDPLGRVTAFTYDSAGNVLTRTNALGNVETMQYDTNGKLVGMTDALGHTTARAYDSAGNQTSYTDASGAVSTNQYDGAGRRTQTTDPAGTTTGIQYDANGNIVGQESASAPTWAVVYDDNGRIVGTAVGGTLRGIARDATGAIASATSQSGAALLVSYDDAGRFAGLADATSGNPLRQQTYDALGNITSMTDASGNSNQFAYDNANRPTVTTYADGSTVQKQFDAAGRVTSVTDVLGHVTQYAYDAAGELTVKTDALGGQTTYGYDATGNLVARTDPAGHITRFAYDVTGLLIQTTFADGSSQSTSYDAAGRPVQIVDSAGHVTSFVYDPLGRVTSVIDALGHQTTYQYQGSTGRSATVDANGNTTTYSYDGRGRLIRTSYPLGDSDSVTYDDSGKVLTKTNGAGESTNYEYDVQGRLAVITRSDSSTASYTYTTDNLVAAVVDAQGTTTFQYDAATRRPVRVTEPDGRYVRYQYDAAGNRTLMAHGSASSELVTTYAYDALGRQVQVTDPTGGVTAMSWDSAGNLALVTQPNGVTTTTTYDARNRPTRIAQSNAEHALLAQQTYTLDASGNRTRVDAADGTYVMYQYDALGHVTREQRYGSGDALQSDRAYGYDAVGNRISAGLASAPATYTYNADNQLLAGAGITYSYDAAGRRVEESWTPAATTLYRRYRWDSENHLVGFDDTSAGVTSSYAYDGYDIRTAKGLPAGAVTFLTDRLSATGFEQIVRSVSTTESDSYVWGSGLLETVQAGAPHFRLADALGSTRQLADAGGTITDSFDYTAFGELLVHAGSTDVPHRFAGEQTDDESGLVYLRARYYDPRTGVFLTRDPAEGNPRDPSSLHPYLYASDNPVNHTDPSGRETLIELEVVQEQEVTLERYEQIANVKREVEKVEEVVADVMRDAGAVLAVQAIVQATQDRHTVLKWFGGVLGVPLGARPSSRFNVADLAAASPAGSSPFADIFGLGVTASIEAVTWAAEFALGKAAFDMFSREDVDMQIGNDALISRPNSGGPTGGCQNAARPHAYAAREGSGWVLGLCGPFFSDTPLPTRNPPFISMAGVMVHEFMHIASNRLIRDDAYQCGQTGALSLVNRLAPGASLFNADNYRCWVEDSAVNFGNAVLDARLPAP